MSIRAIAGCVALSCVIGCGDSPVPASEADSVLGPSAISASPNAESPSSSAATTRASRDVIVNMHDACDPDTFNAVLGAGTCVRNGGVKFADFISQLTRNGFVGSWNFAPRMVNAQEGDRFRVLNRGGEAHTFTEVEEFGGGIVPSLNDLARVPTVAPECQSLAPGDFIAPGQSVEEEIEEGEGEEKYQCCIHPWMRLNARVRWTDRAAVVREETSAALANSWDPSELIGNAVDVRGTLLRVAESSDTAELVARMLEQFRLIRAKADAALEECRIVREKIVRAMQERRDNPAWPEDVSEPKRYK